MNLRCSRDGAFTRRNKGKQGHLDDANYDTRDDVLTNQGRYLAMFYIV